MIGRILYRESCQGMLNYVFGKEGMRILGYGNMCSQDISQKFFGSVLHFQGQRNATKNRYAHITLNLPHGEHLDDMTFLSVSKEYMEQMGYGEQPYVTVRHNDTQHEHIHIITTNVKEDGKVMGTFNSYRRNIATQHYLEKKFGLSPSPRAKQQRELPHYRLPELQFGMDANQGTKFYLQDVLNSILQKHKVRSFEELAKLVKPYHIDIKQTKSKTGSIGVSYGLNNQKGYRTRFINGSVVHRSLSGPKLQKVFDINSKSKLLPMHRKRVLKQIETTYGLFKTIRPQDLTEVLKEYQGIDITFNQKGDSIKGYTIHDKSSYVFMDKEISQKIKIEQRINIFGNGDDPTEIDIHSQQFHLEIRKLLQEAFYSEHLKSTKQAVLFSEWIMKENLNTILPTLQSLERYRFLKAYIPNEPKDILEKVLEQEFQIVKETLYHTESKKEKENFDRKVELIKGILKNHVFDFSKEKGAIHHLFQSLGLEYGNNRLTMAGSDRFVFNVALGDMPLPRNMPDYVSPGFVKQNHILLEQLLAQDHKANKKLGPSAIFLPMIFPKLFETMEATYRQKFDKAAMGSYLKHAEWTHTLFEKSPKDYIKLFNAKGFYFEKGKTGLEMTSIYSNEKVSCPIPRKTNAYLNSSPNLHTTLKEQHILIKEITDKGRNNLRNLWTGHLMEKGLYDKVAFMLINEGAHPNLHREVIEQHMDNGLRKSITDLAQRNTNYQQDQILRKSVYTMNSFLSNRSTEQEEVYNGFKDELTDYSKYKGSGLSM